MVRRQRRRPRRDVLWWTVTPFNYSAVNNAGAQRADGEVLVFLNDDTELLDPAWMKELVGWARRPEIGIAGLQLIGPDGEDPARRRDPRARRLRRPRLRGHARRAATDLRPTDWYRDVPRRDRRLPRRPARGLRRARRARRAVHPLRLATSRSASTPRSWAYATSARRSRAMRHLESATRGTVRAARGLLRQLLAVQPLAVRRRPVLLAEPLARQPRAAALRNPHEPTPQQRVSLPARPQVHRVPAEERRGRVADARRHVPGAADRRVPGRRPCTSATPSRSRSAPSTGSSRTSTARSTAGSTPRCGSPTTSPARTASRTGSSSGAVRPTTSSGPRWPRRSRRWPTARSSSTTAPEARLDAVPEADAGDRDPLGDGVRRGALAEHEAEVLPDPGLRADVLPGEHAVRAGRGDLPAGPVRPVQHRQPAADLRRRLRRQGHVLHARPSTRRSSTRRRPHQRTPDAPGDRVRVRAARPLAQLLGDGVARARGAQAAARRPGADRHRGRLGHRRGRRRGHASTSACSTTGRPASCTATATSAWR